MNTTDPIIPSDRRPMLEPRHRVPPAIYAAALNEVNRLRRDVNAPTIDTMPRGRAFSPNSCPIAEALRPAKVWRVHHSQIMTHHPELDTFATPPALSLFMYWFDDPDAERFALATETRNRRVALVRLTP